MTHDQIMSRWKLVVLMFGLPLLVACVEDTASFNIVGNDYSLTVRREQPYFWKDTVVVSVVTSHLPECRRLYVLSKDASPQFKIEVYATQPGLWTIAWNGKLWQFQSNQCDALVTLDGPPSEGLGPLAGVFDTHNGTLDFKEEAGRPKQVEPLSQDDESNDTTQR